jgi:hypothetical protein
VASTDRILRGPTKPFRRRFDVAEVRTGLVTLCGLGCIAAWVSWKGAHPDPSLTEAAPGLSRRSVEPVERGPLPTALAPQGWSEGKASVYDPANVYVKIDGREGYYKSFGFQKLYFLPLSAGAHTVDLELYDLGSPANALGACAGELPQGASAELRDGSLTLLDKNALFLARGKYYLKAVGSSEEAPVREALASVRERLLAALPSAPLPPSYALFGALGLSPGRVSFLAENAFSFAFASGVHVGQLPDETELFVLQAKGPAEARALAARFGKGFLQYGSKAGKGAGLDWIKDRYLGRVSAAGALGRLVLGVRGAESPEAGAVYYTKLAAAAGALPPGTELGAPPASAEGAKEP